MAGKSRLRKILPDLLVIFSFLFLMASILTVFYLILGWINLLGYIPALATNAEAQNALSDLQDSDGDLLPDIIELAPKDKVVYIPGTGIILGYGTDTDPYNKDTDYDLFTDTLENKMGSDPHNWFFPGIIWIVWAISLGVVIYIRYFRKEDRVKEYIRREEEIMSTGGKYAAGGSSIFGQKKLEDMTSEEKAKLVEDDIRFKQITGFNDVRPDQRIAKGKKYKTFRDGLIAFIIAVALWIAIFGP